jgi:glycosyltransferase involved in cell wall biosynthesis
LALQHATVAGRRVLKTPLTDALQTLPYLPANKDRVSSNMAETSYSRRRSRRSERAGGGAKPGAASPAGPSGTAAQRLYELELLEKSGLFDPQFYRSQYPDIAQAGIAALEHFYDFGCREGRRPNFYFDPQWYLQQNPDVTAAGVHPLTHYVTNGEFEGRKPSLSFDPSWYRRVNGISEAEGALLHYLRNRASCCLAPIPEFDVEHYARSYPDVVAAGIDPFEHFVLYGYLEGRTPSTSFDAKFYWSRYLGGDRSQHPFLHFLAHKHEPGVFGRMPENEASIPREVKRFSRPGTDFEDFAPLPPSAPRRAKLLAYYLPQFHSFAENDAWWGKGFTEWTNIARGLPRFKGHYQPRVPRDLGFYSLDQTETIRRQVEMAKAGGIFGFVFYYYWFNGKRLLDKPVEAFLCDSSLQMPFCIMWANENWTRRWDGADSEVLISQDYRSQDEETLLADFARHFLDPRYIRLKGRPLLMIYRPMLIKDTAATLARWRNSFRSRFNEDPLLILGQTFLGTDPVAYAMDGAIEFPPHKLTQTLPDINAAIEYLDIEFEGKVYRYDDVVRQSLDEPRTAYPLIKTAVPGWDNDARRQGKGLALADSTPRKYQAWLTELIARAIKEPFFGEPIVCINAWNEWCEAAYLEPDVHYGAAYLNATARAIADKSLEGGAGRLLLVGHDCFPGGAQHLLLNIARTLRSHFGVETQIAVLSGGKLEQSYRELGEFTICSTLALLETVAWALREKGYVSAIVNTSGAAAAVPVLKKAGFEVTLLVHELPRLMREKGLTDSARIAAKLADRMVFAAPFVRDQFLAEVDSDRDRDLLIIPQGSYQRIEISRAARSQQRQELAVENGQRLVIGIGYADLRKGFDLFLQLWRLTRGVPDAPLTHFCWVGDIDPGLANLLRTEISDAEQTGTFHMAGYRTDVSAFLSAADAFVLTSREDPFPTVVLEALLAALPVLAFERSGGIPDLLRESPLGNVLPYADAAAMAARLMALMRRAPATSVRTKVRDQIEQQFGFSAYVWKLLQVAHSKLPAVSVAIPNYNYARHIPARLSSVFLQTHPVKEVLVLDDCSTDDSLNVIRTVAREWQREIRLTPNQTNSGSVFRQWRKAAQSASGEFFWIAEADDLCAPTFLSRMIALMRHDPAVQFAFSDSSAIDADGVSICASYKSYYATVAAGALARTEIFDAGDFVARFLSVKNLILNVSAVIWRREALLAAIAACGDDLYGLKAAGDWRLYLEALAVKGSEVAYCAEPLNTHRRHAGSVTHALNSEKHLDEIAACQAFVRSTFRVGRDCEALQDSYLREVRNQLQGPPPTRATAVPAARTKPLRKRVKL